MKEARDERRETRSEKRDTRSESRAASGEKDNPLSPLATRHSPLAACPLPLATSHLLTVDVEDYFQVSAFEHRVSRSDWPAFDCRVEANTDRLLRIFDDCQVRGTFFILGWIARQYPQLVRRIADAGHELASHGFWHQLVYSLAPEAFRQDLRDSVQAIGDAAGVRVTAYRAPSFSITQKSMWALDVLVEEGFTVDSSIFPIRHDRYGVPDARGDIHVRETASGPLVEIPPSVGHWGPIKIPVGGGYFRLFPLPVTEQAIRSLQAAGHPAMIYLHPWEVDPDQPRLPNVGWRSRFRHYVGLHRTAGRLRALLQKYPFVPIRELLASMDPASASGRPSQSCSATAVPPALTRS